MPFLSVLMLFLTALTASAGAWPQEKGQAFVSVTSNLSFPDIYMIEAEPNMYQALYVEYGLTGKLTLGVDAGRSVAGKGKTVVFLRFPIFAGRDKAKYAAELGIGKIAGRAVLRPGMSFGRGYQIGKLSGWMSADAVAEIGVSNPRIDFKLDMTLGLNANNGRKFMIQLQTGAPQDVDPFARISTSIAQPWGKKRHVEMGVAVGLYNDVDVGFKMGIWQQF